MSKFSIIIPVYNVAPYLRECLDSVMAQTFADWEAICVDDGSTDGSGAILDEYAAKDSRFRVIHQKNAGVSAARNAALDIAMGEWVGFLDADDLLRNDAFACVASIAQGFRDMLIVKFGMKLFDGKIVWPCFRACAEVHDIRAGLMENELMTYLWQCFIRREALDNLRFKPYRRGEDHVFLADLFLSRVGAFVETSQVLYGYRQRLGSAMNSSPSEDVIVDEMDHRCDLIRMIDASGKDVDYSKSYWSFNFFELIFFRWLGGRPADEKRRLKEHWLSCAALLSHARFSPWRFRLACKLSVSLRSTAPAVFLCYMPAWWWNFSPSLRIYRKFLKRKMVSVRRKAD